MIGLLLGVAGASSRVEVDLDGDGKPEVVRYEPREGKVHVGPHVLDCEGEPCDARGRKRG